MTRFALLLVLVVVGAGEAPAQTFTGAPPSYPPLLPHISLGGSVARHPGHRHRHSAAQRLRRRHTPARLGEARPSRAPEVAVPRS